MGHTMRKKTLEHLVTTGKIEGKISRRRQRIKLTDSLSTWYDMSGTELLRTTNDRAVWEVTIADTWNRHGTLKKKTKVMSTMTKQSKLIQIRVGKNHDFFYSIGFFPIQSDFYD